MQRPEPRTGALQDYSTAAAVRDRLSALGVPLAQLSWQDHGLLGWLSQRVRTAGLRLPHRSGLGGQVMRVHAVRPGMLVGRPGLSRAPSAEVQQAYSQHLLAGHDCLLDAPTGSG